MSIHTLHARFLLLLPRIEAHAKIYFRDIRCTAQRADQIAETVALAWKWFVRLAKHGKDASKVKRLLGANVSEQIAFGGAGRQREYAQNRRRAGRGS